MGEKENRRKQRLSMKKTPLRKMSKQKQADNRKYRKAKQEWVTERWKEDGLRCQFEGCTELANCEPHHIYGRVGKNLYDKSTFMAVCQYHHRYIHENAKWAREKGYLK